MHCMVDLGGPTVHKTRYPKMRDEIPCGYCLYEWADCYDHIIPVCHGGSSNWDNLYPSCTGCNLILGPKLFANLKEKKNYVEETLKARGEWHPSEDMRLLQEAFPSDKKVAVILRSEMPMGQMGRGPSEEEVTLLRIIPMGSDKLERVKYEMEHADFMMRCPLYLYSPKKGYYKNPYRDG